MRFAACGDGEFNHRLIVEIGRHDIPRHANPYAWVKPRRPIPPERIVEVTERINASGHVVVPLAEDEVRAAARVLADANVQAVAVCLLHAYANPVHEARVAALLVDALPQVMITTSPEAILPVLKCRRGLALQK